MQYKLLRNIIILLSLLALALLAIYYYVHNTSPPHSPPNYIAAAKAPAKPPGSQNRPQTDQSKMEKKTAEKPTEEARSNPPANGPAQLDVSEISTAKPAEPVIVQPAPGTEVSRSTPNTYLNPGYPNLSKNMGAFGQFHYREASGGRIDIDPQWVDANIITIVLPGLNRTVAVHKEAAEHFITAFNYIKNGTALINGQEVPLLSLVKSMDGTFVSRHVNWNPTGGLSNHSWGIAIDINAADHFCYIDPASQTNDPNLILWEKAFQPAGFSWGNRYSDSMHFELLN